MRCSAAARQETRAVAATSALTARRSRASVSRRNLRAGLHRERPLTTRRDFLAGAAGTVAGIVGAPAILGASRPAHDLVIRNGNVIDGTGAAAAQMDVGVS